MCESLRKERKKAGVIDKEKALDSEQEPASGRATDAREGMAS